MQQLLFYLIGIEIPNAQNMPARVCCGENSIAQEKELFILSGWKSIEKKNT